MVKQIAPENIPDHFWSFVSMPSAGDCWLWWGAKNNAGYGIFTLKALGRPWMAHRMSYFLHHHELPDGMFVCHKCDKPQCVNPNHLFLGTAQENMADATRKGRMGPKSKPKKKQEPIVYLDDVDRHEKEILQKIKCEIR